MERVIQAIERLAANLQSPPDVLIVEDDEGDAILMSGTLEKQGCLVTLAGSAEQAFHCIDERLKLTTPTDCHCFDICFLDLKLPKMNGCAVLRILHARMPLCPVVIVTGHPGGAMVEDAAKVGYIGLIEKPLAETDVRRVFAAHKIPLPSSHYSI